MRSPAFAFLLAVLVALTDPATLHAQAAPSGVVRRPSVELAYVREGSGPPLLVIGSAVCYPRWFPPQLRRQFEMIFADARHFARTFQSTPAEVQALTLDAFVEDVEAVRRELGFEKIAVLGHSIHGQIALAYAQKYPERTSHLVMVGGVPFAFAEFASAQQELWASDASPERKELLARGQAQLERVLAAAPANRSFAVSYRLNGPLYWADPRYDAAALLEGVENNPSFTRLAALLPSRAQVRATLERIRIPTLVVTGRLDYAIPYTAWEDLLRGLAHVTYARIDEAGHSPQLEAAEQFSAILAKWYTAAVDRAAPAPRSIVDLGAVVTDTTPREFWGTALLKAMNFTKQNDTEVIRWSVNGVSGSNAYYTLFNHGGPHVDAPAHITAGGGIDSYPVEKFVGPVKVFDVSGYPEGRSVPVTVFRGRVAEGDIVLIWTGYRVPADPQAVPEVRTLTLEAAEYLAKLPVRAYGTDAFGADDFSGTMPMIHQSFLGRGIPIYEQLANLQGVVGKERLLFVGVPLNMQGGDGMLVRPVVLGY